MEGKHVSCFYIRYPPIKIRSKKKLISGYHSRDKIKKSMFHSLTVRFTVLQRTPPPQIQVTYQFPNHYPTTPPHPYYTYLYTASPTIAEEVLLLPLLPLLLQVLLLQVLLLQHY